MRLRLGGQTKLRPARRHSIPISPKASAILVTNTAVGDQQDAARSWIKLRRFRTPKSRQRGRVPPFLQLQQLYLHPGLTPPTSSEEGGPGTQTDCAADYLLVSWREGDVSPEELSKCRKVPGAAPSEDLPPTPAITGERQSPAAAAVDGATKAGWLNSKSRAHKNSAPFSTETPHRGSPCGDPDRFCLEQTLGTTRIWCFAAVKPPPPDLQFS